LPLLYDLPCTLERCPDCGTAAVRWDVVAATQRIGPSAAIGALIRIFSLLPRRHILLKLPACGLCPYLYDKGELVRRGRMHESSHLRQGSKPDPSVPLDHLGFLRRGC
jgi:hypothetical protein